MTKYILELLNEDFEVVRERLIEAKSLEHAQKKSKLILRGYKGTCYFGAMTLSHYGLQSFRENKIRRRRNR